MGLQPIFAIGAEDTTPFSDSTHVRHTGYGQHDGAIDAGDLDDLVDSDHSQGMYIVGAWGQCLQGTHPQIGKESTYSENHRRD
jgi:hypothetical protein